MYNPPIPASPTRESCFTPAFCQANTVPLGEETRVIHGRHGNGRLNGTPFPPQLKKCSETKRRRRIRVKTAAPLLMGPPFSLFRLALSNRASTLVAGFADHLPSSPCRTSKV